MNRSKLKKIIGLAMAVALASNSLTNATINSVNSNTSYSELLKSLRESVLTAPEESSDDYKISDAIDTTSDEVISVIVEFVSEPTAVSMNGNARLARNAESKVERDHRVFEEFLGNMPSTYSGNSIEVKESYSIVYNGMSLNIKASEVENLLKCGVVKRIHKDYEVTVETPVEEASAVETNVIEPFMMDSVPYLGVDDLHKEGVKGTGVKVGVLDTGIDYNHPDLTAVYNGFRGEDGDCNNQDINAVKGWDFIDGDADPMETTYQDWLASGEDEFDLNGTAYYTSHGTHVSGTIAGQASNENAENPVLGVAPEVELYGYRVLGPRGSGATSGIIAAIEKSVLDGMDVINMSLGSSAINDPFDPMVTAVNNATLAGVVTVIASGNSGPTEGTVGAPGTAQLPIVVGASTVGFKYDTYNVSLGDSKIYAEVMAKDLETPFRNLENKELELVYCGLGSEIDFLDVDVKGKVAVIDRGDIALVTKIENAKKAGAVMAIMINNVDVGRVPYLGEITAANTIAVSLKDGTKIKENLDSKITITSTGSLLIEGDEVTSFSSVGPVVGTSEIRPDVVAPGSQVFSTVPEFINDKDEEKENYNIAYQRMSGTSMATPHVAGIAALILQENPDYTPEDVKAAIMNTSENIHQKDGSDYSVHQTGAGRVNPYDAVHEKVSFKAEYSTIAGPDKVEIDNTTSMLSYGRVFETADKDVEKVIPITVTNNSDSTKSYAVSVEYSNSDRAADAESNNVKLNVLNNITVAPGESKTFDAKMVIPYGANYGNYEGYVHFVEAGNEENDYQMPFSASYKKDGFVVLDYPSMSGYGKGMSAFTTSSLLDKHPATYYAGEDIVFSLAVSEPISYIHTFVKDRATGEYIGHAGSQDASWLPEDVEGIIQHIMPGGKVKKIINGNISHEEIPVPSGVYDLEIIAETYEGREFVSSLPVCVINDTKSDEVKFNFNEGIIEVTEDLYTKEYWYDDKEHEGIWIKANVFNKYVEIMKKECGLDYLKQEELNTLFATGYYENGRTIGIGNMPKGNGEILIAGVERSDVEDGFFRVEMTYANAGTVGAKPYNFIFVDKDTQYLSLVTDVETVSENTEFTTEIFLNNVKDVVEGSFAIESYGNAKLKVKEIKPSKELQALLDKNNNDIDISCEKVDGDYDTEIFNISFKLTGDKVKGLNDDIKLFDVEYVVDSIEGVSENLISGELCKYITLKGLNSEFKNSTNDSVDVKAGTMNKSLFVESTERTLIYGVTSTFARGMSDAKVYAVDEAGKRYEPTYFKYDEMLESGHLFVFNNLPVIEGDYKVILETPGAFNGIINVPGSRLNDDNKLVGNTFGIEKVTFMGPAAMEAVLGDTNGDGAIDVVDAFEVSKLYEAKIPEMRSSGVVADLTQDGLVNYADMEAVLNNYLMQDFTREDSSTPQEFVNGNDIYDVLESCGYFDEIPDMNVTLEMDKESSIVGEVVKFTAIPPVEGIDFEYEFSVREKNDEQWTVIQERGYDNVLSWVSEKAGEYAVKVRIFYDEISYVWQDNKLHTVNSLPVDPEQPQETVKTHLEFAVQEAELITDEELSNVVKAVVDEFRAALAEAKEVLGNEKATQEEIDKSFDRLSTVMQMLEFVKGDKTHLISLVERIKTLDSEKYISSTWEGLAVALDAAKAVIADENAMEEGVSESYKDLLKSFLNLRLKPNKDILNDLINKSEGLNKARYTVESWEVFEVALAKARAVMNDEEASKEEISNSESELRVAMNNLQEKVVANSGTSNNTTASSSSNSTTTNNASKGNLPNTGGTPAAAVGLLGTIIATLGAVILKKRK